MRTRIAMMAMLICLTATATTRVYGIVTRHDDNGLASPAEARRFAAVGKVLPDGEAVLIAPTWVLTAGHVATGAPPDRLRVRFAGIEYLVAEVIPYANWQPGSNDIALMRLSTPVQRVAPLQIHNGELHEGSNIFIVGRGDYGNGQKGIVGNDGKFRISRNTIWDLEPERLHVRFESPDDGALPDEGISGPGDSGTPALIERDGRLEVVGIGSVGRSPDGIRYGQYGSIDVFIRTSHCREWILEAVERISSP